jgi:outer membrane protein OmpA-like peptidoglycan-associated protein
MTKIAANSTLLTNPTLFSSRLGIFLLASAVGIPALAQQAQPAATPQDNPPAAQSQPPAPPSTTGSQATAREGFWGRVNPMARKKWVKRQTDPINDRLNELDGLAAKNAKDIQDVDARAQAGIQKAQSAADAANQTATAAGAQAQQASATAQGASGHVDQINGTVNGLDAYHQVTEADIKFHGSSSILTADAKQQLDALATSVDGQHGYILEVEAHAPGNGSLGIQSSQRMAEAVNRYLVTEHNIPVYRLHAVALGNAVSADATSGTPDQTTAKPPRVRTGSVHIRLMENSLAAQATVPPQGAAASTGAERP